MAHAEESPAIANHGDDIDATCRNCGAELNLSDWLCPTCGEPSDRPNVKAAKTPDEKAALSARLATARANANSRGLATEFEGLLDEVRSNSFVVVSVTPLQARSLYQDPNKLYANYESLVGASARRPAPPIDDGNRYSVAGRLFGWYEARIVYGLLSLNGDGLPNYGRVALRLRDEVVSKRVSFLHENSYHFVRQRCGSPNQGIPAGFRSDWSCRAELACAKLEPLLSKNSGPSEWAKLLVVQGKDRDSDDFLEAHVFDGFNIAAVASLKCDCNGASRQDRRDMKTVQQLAKGAQS